MSNYDEAIKDFQEVLKFNPSNSAARQLIQQCREQIKAYHEKEKQLYTSIFAKMAKQSEKVYIDDRFNKQFILSFYFSD